MEKLNPIPAPADLFKKILSLMEKILNLLRDHIQDCTEIDRIKRLLWIRHREQLNTYGS